MLQRYFLVHSLSKNTVRDLSRASLEPAGPIGPALDLSYDFRRE